MRHACERICACKRKDREIPDITHTTLWVVFYLVVSAAIIPRPRGGVGRVSKRTRFAAETASHREVLRLEIQGIHAACGMPANGFALASAKNGRFRHSSKSTFLKDGLGHPCLHEEYEQLLSHNL
jgi:hypothetical protein